MLSFALLGASWVLWLLVGLSIACIAVSLERAFYLLRDGSDRAGLHGALAEFARSSDPRALAARLQQVGGFEARVLGAGLDVADRGTGAVEKAVIGTITAEKIKMERGIAVLATVGSNGPFLGLFGTVLGIIRAFHDLALDSAGASQVVMAGISEALVATAVGLLVAIPAVVLYNIFNRWVRARTARAESLASLLIARLGGVPAHG